MSDDDVSVRSIPVQWSTPGGATLSGRSQVVQPSARDVASYGEGFNACGECRHFDCGDVAQEKIHGERFYERLVREEGWKVKHLCSDPKDLGLCGLSNGETLTGKLHKGCDQFRARNGLVRISAKAR